MATLPPSAMSSSVPSSHYIRRESSDGGDTFSSVDSMIPSRVAPLERRRRIPSDGMKTTTSAAATPAGSSLIQRRSSSHTLDDLKMNKLRFEDLGLYGRDDEVRTLMEALERSRTSRQLVVISGESGSGKSALASKLRDQRGAYHHQNQQHELGDNDFFLVEGKFGQGMRADEPFSAIAVACRQLCGSILQLSYEEAPAEQQERATLPVHLQEPLYRRTASSRSDHRRRSSSSSSSLLSYADVKAKLSKEVGDDGRVLTSVIPSLAQIITYDVGEDPDRGAGGAQQQKNRFFYVFRKFIRAVASFGLVLVLDDLQWADDASLELLEHLLTDRQNSSLMVIGCYRSEEVNDGHTLVAVLERIGKANNTEITRINIRNLSVAEVTLMLIDLLSVDENRAEELGECVYRRTVGNCLFVIQFLKSLVAQKLLTFNLGLLAWVWDIDEITQKSTATDNVVDLVLSRLRTLPPDFGLILPLVASMGNSFDRTEVAIVQEFQKGRGCAGHQMDGESFLTQCIQEGLIEQITARDTCAYRWIHDSIQEAAQALMPARGRARMQFELGVHLLTTQSEEEVERHLFSIVGLLLCGINDVARGSPQRLVFVELILKAGKLAINSSSFPQAAMFLSKGVECIPPEPFSEAYELSLDLYSTAAEASFCVGDLESSDSYCDSVIRNGKDFTDKRRAYNVKMESIAAKGNMAEARKLCIEVLAKLGCHFPRYFRPVYVVAGLIRTKVAIGRIPHIDELPPMTEELTFVMRLIDHLITYSYQGGCDLLPLAILKGFHWTLRYGVSGYAPAMFSLVGLLQVAGLQDFHGSKFFSDQALAFIENDSNSNAAASRTYMIVSQFCIPWYTAVETCRKSFLRGYDVGMKTGDVVSALWNAFGYLEMSLFTGRNLNDLLNDCDLFCQQMLDLNQPKILSFCQNVQQAALNLTCGDSPSPAILDGSVLRDLEVLEHARKVGDPHWTMNLKRAQIHMAFMFGNFERVVELTEETNLVNGGFERALPGSMVLMPLYLHTALACFSLAKETRKSKYRRYARKLQTVIQGWVKKGVRSPFLWSSASRHWCGSSF